MFELLLSLLWRKVSFIFTEENFLGVQVLIEILLVDKHLNQTQVVDYKVHYSEIVKFMEFLSKSKKFSENMTFLSSKQDNDI